MNNKKIVLVLILAFALLLGGASVLYNRLGQELAPDQLAVQQTQPAAQEETAEDRSIKHYYIPVFDIR